MPIWTIPAIAALAAWGLLALLLKRSEILPLDLPNDRSLHSHPMPRIGGMALLPGAAIAWSLSGHSDDATRLLGVLAFVLFLLSLLDDKAGLPITWRFGVHIVVSAVASIALLGFCPQAMVCIFLIAWMTNLYNFMDGANGLAGGMAVIGFGVYALAAEGGSIVFLAAALSGAALGFLAFNFDPARVFLGDAGSVPLGFLAGGLGLVGIIELYWPWWFPLLVFSPFVVDASATLARRVLRRQPFWQAHREHYYQRLVRMGWSHRRLALAEYALMLLASASALLLRRADGVVVAVAGLFWCLTYATLMGFIDRRWSEQGAM